MQRTTLHLVKVNMFEKITLAEIVSNALSASNPNPLQSQEELF